MANLKPAARLLDNHPCPAHGGGPLVGPGAATVLVEGRPLILAGDTAACNGGPPDAVVTGAATVQALKKLAVRESDHTMHGGVLVRPLSDTVYIGGPAEGVTIGDLPAAARRCKLEATGRSSGSTQQSYGNCGVESARQLINQRRERAGQAPIGEDPLLNSAIAGDDAEASSDPTRRGSTSPQDRSDILTNNGVANHQEPQTGTDADLTTIGQHLHEGRGVITTHRTGKLWNTSHSGYHALNIVGIQYDANGRPVEVVTNDTGRASNNCLRRYPADRFVASIRNDRNMNVTNDRAW